MSYCNYSQDYRKINQNDKKLQQKKQKITWLIVKCSQILFSIDYFFTMQSSILNNKWNICDICNIIVSDTQTNGFWLFQLKTTECFKNPNEWIHNLQ